MGNLVLFPAETSSSAARMIDLEDVLRVQVAKLGGRMGEAEGGMKKITATFGN